MEDINNTDITNQVLDNQPAMETPTPPKQNNNVFKLLFFISIFVLIAVIVIGFLIFKNYTKETVVKETNNNQIQTTEETEISPTLVEEGADKTLELNKEPISYSNENNFQVSKKEFSLLNYFNASELETLSKECETNKSESYFKNILSKFNEDDKGYIYEFKYPNQTQGSGIWKVTVIPNKIGYKDLSEFKSDFDLCLAGGGRYPELMSKDYLMFISSCGTGYDDGSGIPHGCDIVKKSIESTIKLN